MKTQRALVALTLLNLGLFACQLTPLRRAEAQGAPTVLRGSGIEIVDDQGRLRAQLKIEPADKTFKMPDGRTGYPETVIFRLITADGKPRVKLTTSEEGSGLMVLGQSDTTHALLLADGGETSLKLRNSEATQRVVKP